MNLTIDNFTPDYCKEIYPNVWLMDNHKWAYYAWENWLNKYNAHIPITLLHLDYHWEGINDFHTDSDQNRLYKITSIDEIYSLIKDGKLIRYDSFIAPAIIRGIINEVHFYCFQDEVAPGLYEEFLERFKVKQVIHDELKSLISCGPKGGLVDIDLDIFNKAGDGYPGELWGDIEILDFIEACRNFIKYSPLITIAMSSGCSISYEETMHLTKLVLPKILEFRREEIVTAYFPIHFE